MRLRLGWAQTLDAAWGLKSDTDVKRPQMEWNVWHVCTPVASFRVKYCCFNMPRTPTPEYRLVLS